jgi:hypothetical protein
MGAALHLATAHQIQPEPQSKRKGGGGGDGYDAFVARVWQDTRLTPEARELLLLIVWLSRRDPKLGQDGQTFWGRAGEILGADGQRAGRARPRLATLVDSDRPRYEPDWADNAWQHRACQSPMIRRAGECGQHATDHSTRVAADTGWLEPVWYCSRHRDFGRAAEAAYRAQDKPFPIPNRGGMLPSYLKAKGGDEAWVKLYEWASKWCFSSWKPPQGYGLAASEWPVPGQDRPVQVPRLRLAALDGELLNGEG